MARRPVATTVRLRPTWVETVAAEAERLGQRETAPPAVYFELSSRCLSGCARLRRVATDSFGEVIDRSGQPDPAPTPRQRSPPSR